MVIALNDKVAPTKENKILERAKQKYRDAKRNYEYYESLLAKQEDEHIRFKKGQMFDIMETLIYVVGKEIID